MRNSGDAFLLEQNEIFGVEMMDQLPQQSPKHQVTLRANLSE